MRDIILITFNGLRYGIWKDEVVSIREAGTLHRFPLSPACIAGITLIDEQTVTIADFWVCIGRTDAAKSEKRSILLLNSGEKPTGFLVAGDMETRSLSHEQVLPMPDYLRTESISSCVMRNAVPIPVVDPALLYGRFLKGDQDALRPPLTVSHDRQTPSASIQLFRIGKEVYGYG